jgi:hypothetical protein
LEPATKLTDIYDLGRLAHFLMTLARPRKSVLDRLAPLVWPDHVPPDVRAVIDRAIAIYPADRLARAPPPLAEVGPPRGGPRARRAVTYLSAIK